MEYCYLGRSGLEVSRIGLGSIPFGTGLDEAASKQIADIFLDAGGNLIDTEGLSPFARRAIAASTVPRIAQ